MELNDELKLLLIKTQPHKDDSAAQDLFNRIVDNDEAWTTRLDQFYLENNIGTTDSDGIWIEPTETELRAKLIEKEFVQPIVPEIWELEGYENEAAWIAKDYARNRAREYPSIADQLDEIYHNGLDSWKAKIKEIKDKYPKE